MLLFTPCMECCGNASCLHILNRKQWKQEQENHHSTIGKLLLGLQFCKSRLTRQTEFSELWALHLAQLGLTAGWLAAWLASCPADKMQVNVWILNFPAAVNLIIRFLLCLTLYVACSFYELKIWRITVIYASKFPSHGYTQIPTCYFYRSKDSPLKKLSLNEVYIAYLN